MVSARRKGLLVRVAEGAEVLVCRLSADTEQ